MTIGKQLELLRNGLADWAAENSAQVAVAADRGEFLTQIQNNPTGLPVVLMFQGETMKETDAEALVVWRTFVAVLARQHGWTAVRAENLTNDSPAGPALFTLIEGLRNSIINVDFGTLREFRPRYMGASMLDTAEAPLDAWQIEFECGAFLNESAVAAAGALHVSAYGTQLGTLSDFTQTGPGTYTVTSSAYGVLSIAWEAAGPGYWGAVDASNANLWTLNGYGAPGETDLPVGLFNGDGGAENSFTLTL